MTEKIIREKNKNGQEVFSGEGCYQELAHVLQAEKVKKPMIVCGKASFDNSFIRPYLEALDYEFTYFRDYSVNPAYEDIIKGVELFKKNNCDFIISIGGGSTIDVAKCIKLFSQQEEGKLWINIEYSPSSLKHLCLPTTSGSGSEATRFAVIYYKGEKQSVHHNCIIPDYVILEADFLASVSAYQKRSTILDALCQAAEAYWSVNSNDEAKAYSKEALALLFANVDGYLVNDKTALQNVMKASNLSGLSINISETTVPHALSYKLVSTYKISHGHAVALTFPHVWRFIAESISDNCCDKRGKEYVSQTMQELNYLFGADDYQGAIKVFNEFFAKLNIEEFEITDSEELVALSEASKVHRLKNIPVTITPDDILPLYFTSLCNIHVKEIQKECLEILKAVDKLCRDHCIKYYMTEGSLLGAIRHQGFIPWDDDLDIAMERADYLRFVELAKDELPADFKLYWHNTTENWWPALPRVTFSQKGRFERYFTSTKKEEEILEGACVDIFPLDSVPKRKSWKQSLQWGVRASYKRAARYNRGVSVSCDSLLACFLIFVGKLLSFKTLIKKVEKWQTKYNHPDNEYLFSSASNYSCAQATFAKSWFAKQLWVPFADMEVPVPVGFEEVLKTTYGDFRQVPKIEERISDHHNRLKAKYLKDRIKK